MKFIRDGFDFSSGDIEVVKESSENSTEPQKYYIQGIFAQAELKNRNGRIYPRSSMENAVRNYNTLIESKRAFGELNHPDNPSVDLERVCHVTESLYFEGNNVMGRARVLTELPMGKIVKGFLDEGVQLGVSTRGLGSLQKTRNANIVQDDFLMTAIDVVADPSARDAFVQGIMEESEWIYNASTNSWMLAEQIKNDVKKLSTKQVSQKQSEIFEKF